MAVMVAVIVVVHVVPVVVFVACLLFTSSNALPCSECATEPQLETCSGNQAGQSNILISNEISVILIITIYLFVIRLFEISNKSSTNHGIVSCKIEFANRSIQVPKLY